MKTSSHCTTCELKQGCKQVQGSVSPVKDDWPSEERIDQIGQNGNDGLHYEEMNDE